MVESILEQLDAKVTFYFSKSKKDRVKVTLPEKEYDLISGLGEKDRKFLISGLKENLRQNFPTTRRHIAVIMQRGKDKDTSELLDMTEDTHYWIDESPAPSIPSERIHLESISKKVEDLSQRVENLSQIIEVK